MDVNHLEHHSHKLHAFLIVVALLLAIGEFIIYRDIQNVKAMVSETAMQIKELDKR